ADILREKFLGYFREKKHKILESDTLLPADDPTVLFTPAGMNQFKKQFLGLKSDFKRAATAQRCLRTDDLDKVGLTPGHHTFFEMLGNFSFGDYFKEEAIFFAWEFLTKKLKIHQEKLWVSIYKDDDEADKIWRDKIRIPAERIIKLGDKENFWPSEAKEKGPNGPCGPCSEIFFDQGKQVGCGREDCNPACGCARFVEVWNLVFTQFNRKEGGILEPLPKRNIDTGMGLERLAAVMQGELSNFETELFQPIIQEIVPVIRLSGYPDNRKELVYAIADHIRAITFSIYDGVMPSNEGRGYVVRKIIRKGLLHLRTMGQKRPFLYKLVPVVAQIMQEPYPELKKRQENIAEIILSEEKNFIATLDSSDVLLGDNYKGLKEKQDPVRAGIIAFALYDTYGIPWDLTKDWLDRKGISVSAEQFQEQLKQQKERSKAQSAMKGEVFAASGRHLEVKATKFLGYKNSSVKAKILKIMPNGAEIILDQTCFYPESGGQVGDTGQIIKGRNIFEVLDTKKIDHIIVHLGKIKEGSFKKGDLVLASIDQKRRLAIAKNHTATHLLQAALRKVLGAHVKQQGSLVAADRLRFDFTHFKDIPDQELRRIEQVVNDYISSNYRLEIKEKTLSAAKKEGALAFFAEKYADKVRVVSIGDFSKELCGGTHVGTIREIGVFKITQEGSVASGIRRIEAVTGQAADKLIKQEQDIIKDTAAFFDVPEDKIIPELEKKFKHVKGLEKQLALKKIDLIKTIVESLLHNVEEIKGIKLITKIIPNLDMEGLRRAVDLVKDKTANTIVALGSKTNERALLVVGITADLCARGLDAAGLIQEAALAIGGSGGGRKDFAQAGGSKPGNFNQAFNLLKEKVVGAL
ncbi:MAG: alanine--tRNA ligase, partial [Candidatus Omnitrophica bacterium]|nr:alanine--tRNA ligase [Candidatus Omnitrophota bacterium]